MNWNNGSKDNKKDWKKKFKQLRNVYKKLKNHLNQLRPLLSMRFKFNWDPSDNVSDKSKPPLPVTVLFWPDLKEFTKKKLLKNKKRRKWRKWSKTITTNKNTSKIWIWNYHDLSLTYLMSWKISFLIILLNSINFKLHALLF